MNPDYDKLLDVLMKISLALNDREKKLTLILPPPLDDRMNTLEFPLGRLIKEMEPHVHNFIIVIQDYSSVQRPGPGAPIQWIDKAVDKLIYDMYGTHTDKLHLSLALYGLDFTANGGGKVEGKDVVRILTEAAETAKFASSLKIIYNAEYKEHNIEAKVGRIKHNIYYPSLQSLKLRMDFAEENNMGIALMIIGQGLDYFFDLL